MIQLIPAIDIIDGKCVRLVKGDYNRKSIYSEDPVETARMFESWGISRLHLVDLDGAKAGHIINSKVLNRIASETGLIIDFGGGIRSSRDVRIAFDNGAAMISGGSIAVHDPKQFIGWLEIYGNEKIILGADHNNRKISINAWTKESKIELFPFLGKFIKRGIKKVICTDIQKDGMLEGPSLDLYNEILNEWPGLELIASGGVGNFNDIVQLGNAGVPAVIIGKAIYEKKISRKEITTFLS